MVHSNDDAMNKIPLKSVTDDEEKNGVGEFLPDTSRAEEARREERRVKILQWMKKLTIGIICFIGIALICYVIINLSLSDWSKSTGKSKMHSKSVSVSKLSATRKTIIITDNNSTTTDIDTNYNNQNNDNDNDNDNDDNNNDDNDNDDNDNDINNASITRTRTRTSTSTYSTSTISTTTQKNITQNTKNTGHSLHSSISPFQHSIQINENLSITPYHFALLLSSDNNNNNDNNSDATNVNGTNNRDNSETMNYDASNATLLANIQNYNNNNNNNSNNPNNNNMDNDNDNDNNMMMIIKSTMATASNDYNDFMSELQTSLPTVMNVLPENTSAAASANDNDNDNDDDDDGDDGNSDDAISTSASINNVSTFGTTLKESSDSNDASSSSSSSISSISSLPTMATLKDIPIIVKNYSSIMGVYQNAAICSDKHVCSQIGSKILQDGGSAVDSAIAALLCNGITTLHSMGIGGGMLMNIYIKDREQAFSVDGREVAPFGATQDMFNEIQNISEHGALTIAVPGELKGYQRAHEKFGKLPWKQLIEPSIRLCHDGFYMNRHIWQSAKHKMDSIKRNEILREMFYDENTGDVFEVGSKIKPVKQLCHTYELLAENGPIDFYNGTLAQLVVEDLEELGSLVTFDDLESYRADMVNSITMQLGESVLHAVPPVSSGPIVANILSILEGFNFTKSDLRDEEHAANAIHLMTEAMKLSFAKRWELGDVRFNDVRELVSRLTNPETGAMMRPLINKAHTLNSIHEYGALFSGEDDAGTSHLSVLAPNGDAVSVTSSINEYFGSTFVGRRTGIIFNNGMHDFSIPGRKNIFNLPPSPTNFIEPQKRPMSSMSPMIVTDAQGSVNMVVGAAGGSRIITAIVEVMARVLWFGQTIKQAIDAPRFHHQLMPNILQYEDNRFSQTLLKLLQAKGHRVEPYDDIGSVVCGIVRNETAIYANADYRKQGGTAGF